MGEAAAIPTPSQQCRFSLLRGTQLGPTGGFAQVAKRGIELHVPLGKCLRAASDTYAIGWLFLLYIINYPLKIIVQKIYKFVV